MMNNEPMRRLLRLAVCWLGVLLLAPNSWAQQNSIENIEVTQASGQVLVRVTLKEPLQAAPGSFTVANPARIALDFPGTANALGRTSQEVGENVLRSMNIVQAGDRTRLVLNLRNMVPYETKIDGSALLITLSAFDLGQDRLPNFAAFRFLYERLVGAAARPWLPSAFCAAAALPHLHPDRRRTLLQSISESAATAPVRALPICATGGPGSP